MRCKVCGMETTRTDACDFCGTALSAGPAPRTPLVGARPLDVTQPVPPPVPPPLGATQAFAPQAPQVRMTLAGEAVQMEPGPPTPLAPAPLVPGPPHGAPAAIPPRIFNPAAGLPASAVGVSLAQSISRDRDAPTVGARWELTLAIFLPVMALSVLLIKLVPSSTLWLQFVDYFVVGLALGASAVIPSYDDAFMDCAVALAVCFVFGPLLGLIIYLIVGAIRQEWNTAILFLLLGNTVVASVVAAAALSTDSLAAVVSVGLGGFMRFFGVCMTFAGWMFSNFFRPVNE